MRVPTLAGIGLLSLLMSQLCHAGAPSDTTPIKVEGYQIIWASKYYPSEAKARHAQGSTEVQQSFLNGKAIGEAKLVLSSREPELDAKALEIIHSLRLKSTGTDEAPEALTYIFPVDFVRDTVRTISSKPCSEITEDIAYFKASNPGAEIGSRPFDKMVLGMLAIQSMGIGNNAKRMANLAKAFKLANPATAVECEQHPETLFIEVLQKQLRNFS
ncbi:TonB-like protein [Janthinobacterium sp. 64]|nr:TonB-like protein [Janthinobacterium sp. 64]